MIEPMQNFFMMCVVMKAGRPHMTSYELFNFSDIKNYPATQFWGSFLGVILWSCFIWSFFIFESMSRQDFYYRILFVN